jgi:hypothetical protein
MPTMATTILTAKMVHQPGRACSRTFDDGIRDRRVAFKWNSPVKTLQITRMVFADVGVG